MSDPAASFPAALFATKDTEPKTSEGRRDEDVADVGSSSGIRSARFRPGTTLRRRRRARQTRVILEARAVPVTMRERASGIAALAAIRPDTRALRCRRCHEPNAPVKHSLERGGL
jgi:hypothetical protein